MNENEKNVLEEEETIEVKADEISDEKEGMAEEVEEKIPFLMKHPKLAKVAKIGSAIVAGVALTCVAYNRGKEEGFRENLIARNSLGVSEGSEMDTYSDDSFDSCSDESTDE